MQGSMWWTDAVGPLQQGTFPHLLLALLLGTIIGAERQWRQRAAGLRTNTLVCLGAAAFVDLGLTVSPKTTQVIAYVVSGVGFLGAGAIMKDGASIRGLNTAATLWCSAAVGACAGAGELLDAVFVTGLLMGVNVLLRPLGSWIDRRSLATVQTETTYRVRVTCETKDEDAVEATLTKEVAQGSMVLTALESAEIEETTRSVILAVLQSTTRDAALVERLVERLRALPWTESVDWKEIEGEGAGE